MSTPVHTKRAVAMLLAFSAAAACASTGSSDTAAANEAELQAYQQAMADAIAPATPEQIAVAERSDPLTRANFWANEFQKDQTNPGTTLAFIRALRAIGSHDRVIEVGTSILPLHPQNYEILLEVGRSLLSKGEPEAAAQALVRSADFSPPTEAAPLAALGLAFDRIEDHDKAQQAYREALKREPDRVSTLSNYGLSLALSGNLEQAELHLQRAASLPGADGRVRQNLALVLGLQGKFEEMAAVDPAAPRRTIEANRRVLRQMIIPARSYEALAEREPIALPARPADVQTMPEVQEALVDEDVMTEPLKTPDTDMQDAPLLTGEPEAMPPARLRSRLRGTQG
ncbi:hypothetical protein RYZ27_11010 [Hyphomonas sp. FCG-A18]|uniref:tetratricopeptide repeat protein n=1 Tax=Hyphomonas sp. FCG-A18 TaxID=3080019 RepID=UPI002B2D4B0B|nr:hypothetical protein RYZ27_11010 [Hyphomonas sp. FCG-A18]